MAKGNFLLGYARGSVGDVTFSRVKGNQVAKARNRNPVNPNTIPQAMQRSLFADAVRFYTRGVQNAFKFAFERKLENESDYNAFMRLNVHRGVRIGKSPDAKYPAIGDWLVADGSITPPLKDDAGATSAIGDYCFNGGYLACDMAPATITGGTGQVGGSVTLSFSATAAPTTIGALSSLLLAQYPQLRNGDIVTIMLITQSTVEPGDLFPNSHGYDDGVVSDPAWSFAQFAIDESSTAAVATIYHSSDSEISVSVVDGVAFVDLRRYEVITPIDAESRYGSIAAGAVIFSRQTSSGLLVSNAPLSRGYQYGSAVDYCRTKQYEDAVMVDWGAADPAILQGYFVQA